MRLGDRWYRSKTRNYSNLERIPFFLLRETEFTNDKYLNSKITLIQQIFFRMNFENLSTFELLKKNVKMTWTSFLYFVFPFAFLQWYQQVHWFVNVVLQLWSTMRYRRLCSLAILSIDNEIIEIIFLLPRALKKIYKFELSKSFCFVFVLV